MNDIDRAVKAGHERDRLYTMHHYFELIKLREDEAYYKENRHHVNMDLLKASYQLKEIDKKLNSYRNENNKSDWDNMPATIGEMAGNRRVFRLGDYQKQKLAAVYS